MAQYNLGKVSIRPRGAYAANTNYEFLDSVQNLGGSWLALAASKDVQPGVTAGWQNYWMMITRGIKTIVGSSPADGQTQITITFTDGATATYTYNNEVLADGSVNRAKLADDALYSPNVYVSASRKIQASDLGKKLFASGANNNCVLTLDDATSAEFAIGTEIFFGWVNASSPLSIKFSGVNFILKGSKEVNTSAKDVTVKLVEQGSAASIIKYSNVTSTSNSRWFLTGDVEVVT